MAIVVINHDWHCGDGAVHARGHKAEENILQTPAGAEEVEMNA